MKICLMTLALGGMLAGVVPAQAAKPAKPAPTKAAASVTLPAGAKKTGDGTWEHTDASGKQWIYKQMPFGLTRMTKGDIEARSGTTLPEGMTVVEENGAYKFTRNTPFGAVAYSKKADELSETERALVAAKARKAAVTAQK